MTKHENLANLTTNRGVEVKELELTNIRLDRNTTTSSSSIPVEASTRLDTSVQSSAPPPQLDASASASGSYMQVVVQQQRRSAGARLPSASSPVPQVHAFGEFGKREGRGNYGDSNKCCECGRCGECGRYGAGGCCGAGNRCGGCGVGGGCGAGGRCGRCGDGAVLVPASLLLACAQPQANSHPTRDTVMMERSSCVRQEGGGGDRAGCAHESTHNDYNSAAGVLQPSIHEKIQKKSAWKMLSNFNTDQLDIANAAERVEVYYFEHGCGEWLSTSDAARATACERAGARAARRAAPLLAELLAAAHLLLALPRALLLSVQRCALMAVRDLVAGTVQTASDYALKPALALVFNALVQPPLVLAANVGRALRAALRPFALAAGDALEPLARVLASLRLVHVRLEPTCRGCTACRLANQV